MSVLGSYSSHMLINHQPAFLCQRLNCRGGAGVSQRINDFSLTERKRDRQVDLKPVVSHRIGRNIIYVHALYVMFIILFQQFGSLTDVATTGQL